MNSREFGEQTLKAYPPITQRNSRSLLFKIRKDKQPFQLDGSKAIFVMKPLLETLDTDPAVKVKRSSAYTGGPGDDSEIIFVNLPPPNGGTPIKWGLKVILKPTDSPVDLEPGEYYIQVDIIPVDPTDRFTPVKGWLTIEKTGIQTL